MTIGCSKYLRSIFYKSVNDVKEKSRDLSLRTRTITQTAPTNLEQPLLRWRAAGLRDSLVTPHLDGKSSKGAAMLLAQPLGVKPNVELFKKAVTGTDAQMVSEALVANYACQCIGKTFDVTGRN